MYIFRPSMLILIFFLAPKGTSIHRYIYVPAGVATLAPSVVFVLAVQICRWQTARWLI